MSGGQTYAAKTFHLNGSYDQRIILISAVRYAWGRSTYMPSSTCEILARQIDELDPMTAYIIARDIRDYWTRDYGGRFGKPAERGTFYDSDVQPFVDLLPKLDEASRCVLTGLEPYMSEPQPPVGYDRWDEVPEEVRYRWPTE